MTLYQLRIPFHQTFSHALHSQEESDAVIVKVTDLDGRSGFGESLPRSYVTGETTESMIARIREQLAPKVLRASFAPGWETFEYVQSVMAGWTRNADRETSIVAWNAPFAPWSPRCSIGACERTPARSPIFSHPFVTKRRHYGRRDAFGSDPQSGRR